MNVKQLIKAGFALDITTQSAPQGPPVGRPRHRPAGSPALLFKAAGVAGSILAVGKKIGKPVAKATASGAKRGARAASRAPRMIATNVPKAAPAAAKAVSKVAPNVPMAAAKPAVRGAQQVARKGGRLGGAGKYIGGTVATGGLLTAGGLGTMALMPDTLQGHAEYKPPADMPWEGLPPEYQNAIQQLQWFEENSPGASFNPKQLRNLRHKYHGQYATDPNSIKTSLAQQLMQRQAAQKFIGQGELQWGGKERPLPQVPHTFFSPEDLEALGWDPSKAQQIDPQLKHRLLTSQVGSDPRRYAGARAATLSRFGEKATTAQMGTTMSRMADFDKPIGTDIGTYQHKVSVPETAFQKWMGPELFAELKQTAEANKLLPEGSKKEVSPAVWAAYQKALYNWEVMNKLGYVGAQQGTQ